MNPFATIFLDDSRPIHERYQILANYLDVKQPVLKTDLWNELKTQWPIRADLYVEIDQEMVNEARLKGLNAIGGSIEKLPLQSQTITTILDFSTLDHIPEPFPAIKEYYRVLKNNAHSRCLVISWVGNKVSHQMTSWIGLQYYFDEVMLIEKIIRAGFIIQWQEKFEGFGDQTSKLKCFYLRKSGLYDKISHNLLKLLPAKMKPKVPDSFLTTNPMVVLYPVQMAQYPLVNIEPAEQNGSNSFCFTAKNEDPQIILTGLNLPDENLLLKIEIDAPTTTHLQLFYFTPGIADFKENFSVTRRIFPGHNLIRVLIPKGCARDRLRLDPGGFPGKYSMGRIEIFTINENTRD